MTMPSLREACSYATGQPYVLPCGRAVLKKPVASMDKKGVWEFVGLGHCSSASGMACTYCPQKQEHFGQPAIFECLDCQRLKAAGRIAADTPCLHSDFVASDEHDAVRPVALALDTARVLELAEEALKAAKALEAAALAALAV
jgi:hypothetical protein